MAESAISKEKIDAFMAKVVRFREDMNNKTTSPKDIVLMAARNEGIGSAVLPLAFAGLLSAVDCEEVDCGKVNFWINASVGNAFLAGSMQKEWLDAFYEYFFCKVSGVRDLPSPYQLEIDMEIANLFQLMLQSAVAVAESKGKIGKIAINKCTGFKVVKYWSESGGWHKDGGFTDGDREMLKAIAGQKPMMSVGENQVVIPNSEELADVKKRLNDCRAKLKDEQNKSSKIENRLQTIDRELDSCKKQLDAERSRGINAEEMIESLKRDKEKLREEIDFQKKEFDRLQYESQKRIDEKQRLLVMEGNKQKARNDAIAEVVSPIKRQLEEVENHSMSVEMGGALFAHINRVIKVLEENGFEI